MPLTEFAPLPVPAAAAPVPTGATPPTSVAEVANVARVVLVLVTLGIAEGPVVRNVAASGWVVIAEATVVAATAWVVAGVGWVVTGAGWPVTTPREFVKVVNCASKFDYTTMSVNDSLKGEVTVRLSRSQMGWRTSTFQVRGETIGRLTMYLRQRPRLNGHHSEVKTYS